MKPKWRTMNMTRKVQMVIRSVTHPINHRRGPISHRSWQWSHCLFCDPAEYWERSPDD